MASKQPPAVEDVIESIELPGLQPLSGVANGGQDAETTTQDQTNSQRSTFKVFTVMVALFTTVFIVALNITIVATAAPTICEELDAAWGYSWIGASYVIASTTVSPIWIKLSDIWGRKRILLIGVAFYSATSILCAVSRSMAMLVVSRALQGVASGGLGLVTVVVSDLYSMRSRPFFLGLLHLVFAVAGGVGPVLGGAFTQLLSWRWIFWINLPVTGLAFCLLLFFLDVHDPKTKFSDGIRAVDWFGSFSIIGVMVMVLLGLNFGGTTYPWDSPKVICLIVFGVSLAIIFLFSEGRLARYPIMPLGIFRSKSNIACLAIGFFQHFVLNAVEYYLPLYFQSAREASPLRSGALLLPLIVTEAVVAIAAGIFISKSGRYLELIYIGGVLLTIGNGLYIKLSAVSSVGSVFAFEIVAGMGVGLLFEPPLIALQASVSQDNTATAIATLSLIRNIGTALSIVVGGVIFQNGMQLQSAKLQKQGLPASLVMDVSGADAATNVGLIGTISNQTQRLAVRQAFASSLKNLWILCTCMAACGLLVSVLVTKKKLSREHTETRTGIKGEENKHASIPHESQEGVHTITSKTDAAV